MSENGKTMTSDAVSRMDEFVDSFQQDVHRFCWDSLDEGEEGTYERINELLLQMSWPRPHQEKAEKEKPKILCSTCVWCDSLVIKDKGLCRKHAPEFIPGEGTNEGFWPIVQLDDWCGFHEVEEE